jgi:hypothetical protein
MAHAQFRDLGSGARNRTLVAFATGLRVIDRSKAVAQRFHFLEFRLIGLMSRIIRHAVTLVVETSGRFGKL